MKHKIIALTDYKDHFGSKHFASPYRSGMDRNLLAACFNDAGFLIEFVPVSEVASYPPHYWKNLNVIYTSSEDPGYHYKSFIEDVVFYLSRCGARLIPSPDYLRANNNKVYMELLRSSLDLPGGLLLKTRVFGSPEEIADITGDFVFPVVVKGAGGAMGRNVMLARNTGDLLRVTRKLSRSGGLSFRTKELVRKLKHKGYTPESSFRTKFIIQSFVPGLQNDWKVYVMGPRIYIFCRPVFKHRQFRASGGGYENYTYGIEAMAPEGIFDFAREVFRKLDVPMVSLDIARDGNSGEFILFEFQAIYFGTAGILNHFSSHYFEWNNNSWVPRINDGSVEKVFAGAVAEYISSRT